MYLSIDLQSWMYQMQNEHPKVFMAFGLMFSIGVPLFIVVHGYLKYSRRYKQTKIDAGPDSLHSLHSILQNRFPYYNQLPQTLKEEFRYRTLLFANQTSWHSGDGILITDEMKLLISATATQILFGLPDNRLISYRHIVIMSEPYTNPQTLKKHKGEVNANAIYLCWRSFQEGFHDYSDKLNLGLHEMAHALDLSISNWYGSGSVVRGLFDYFRMTNVDEYYQIRNGESHRLREYAGSNLREFFAVAVEHFFEAPQYLQDELPGLYKSLCLILNQDPLNHIYRDVIKTKLYSPYSDLNEESELLLKERFRSGKYNPERKYYLGYWAMGMFIVIVLSAAVNVVVFRTVFVLSVVAVSGIQIARTRGYRIRILSDFLVVEHPTQRNKPKRKIIYLKNILFVDSDYSPSECRLSIMHLTPGRVEIFKISEEEFYGLNFRHFIDVLREADIPIRENSMWLKKDDRW